MHRLAFVCLVLAACTDEPNAHLAELPNLQVDVNLIVDVDDNDSDSKSRLAAEVNLTYDINWFDSLDRDRKCASIDAGGTFNGVPFTLNPGGYDEEWDDCDLPSAYPRINLGGDEPGRLELVDDRGNTVITEFPAGAARVASSSTGWTFLPGQQVTLAWSHPDDATQFDARDIRIYFRHQLPYEVSNSVVADEFTGKHVTFTIPRSLPFDGDGVLRIIVGQGPESTVVMPVTSCIGAQRCAVRATRGYEHAIRILK